MDLTWFKRYPNYVAAALLLMVFFSQLAIRWDQLEYYFTKERVTEEQMGQACVLQILFYRGVFIRADTDSGRQAQDI